MTHDDLKVGFKVTFMANIWEDHKWVRKERTGKIESIEFWHGDYHYKCKEDKPEGEKDVWYYCQTFECDLADILKVDKPPEHFFDGDVT